MKTYRSYRTLVLFLLLAFPSLAAAQGALTNGGNHTGSISSAGEIDEFTFNANINESIVLSIGEVLPAGPDPNFVPWIRLRRPDGVEIASDAGQLTASINIAAPLSGTYTVLVRDWTQNRPGTALGTYILHFLRLGTGITPTIPSGDDGGVLTNGGQNAGRIGAPGATPTAQLGDVDVWTFEAAQNEAIALSIGEVLTTEIDPDFRPWIRLFGPTGAYITQDAGLLTASINTPAPLSGTYTVVVADWIQNREGSHVNDYRLHLVRAAGPYTHGDDGGVLTNGGQHSGRIGAAGADPRLQRGDLDVWTFQAAQNQAIALSVGEVLTSEIDPDFRPWIRLIGPNGVYITQEAGILSASINIAAPLSGTYTVIVADWIQNREGSHLGDYVLHLVKGGGPYTHGDNGGVMVSGGNYPGRIGAAGADPRLQRGDLDVWTFQAIQNEAIALSIGEVLTSETDPDLRPWIRLIGPDGVYITQDAGILAASINLEVPLSGTYTVIVADWIQNREGSHLGDYVLHFVKAIGPHTTPAGDDGGAMANGVTYGGRIGAPGADLRLQRGDLDVWTFCAAQGTDLTINISEINIPTPDSEFQPWIRLNRPDGRYVTQAAGVVNASINLDVPLSGRYTVIVGDWIQNREGSHLGDYQLSAFGLSACPAVPTTVEDAYSTAINTPLSVAAPGVLANDNSNLGGAMTAELISAPSVGTLTLNPGGNFTFTPPAGFTGSTTFTYRALNSAGAGNIVTVTLTVTPGTPPTANPDSYSTGANVPLSVPAPGVLANDAANGGGALTAELVSSPANGALTFSATGAFTYTPNASFSGADTFSYRAVSNVGPSSATTVTITVGTVNPGTVLPPTNVYVAKVAGNLVTLRWTPPAGGSAPSNYVLEGGVASGQTLASIPTGGTNPIFTFAAPTGAFYIRMHTLSGALKSVASNEVRLFVNVRQAPSAPENLLGLVNGSSIALAWRNTFGGGAPGGVVLDVRGALNTTLPLGLAESFQFNGVPGGTYTLSLRAVNAAGTSAASNAITLTFPGPCSGAPLAPSQFLAYRVGRSLFVVWDPATSGPAPTSFVLNVTGGFTGALGTTGRSLSGQVGPGTYNLSVTAANACGTSAATAVQTVIVP